MAKFGGVLDLKIARTVTRTHHVGLADLLQLTLHHEVHRLGLAEHPHLGGMRQPGEVRSDPVLNRPLPPPT